MHCDHKRSHLENRARICLVCGEKGEAEIKGKLLDAVKMYVLNSYDPQDYNLPSALCNTHRKTMYEYYAGRKERVLRVQDLSIFQNNKCIITRSSICENDCEICNQSRYNLNSMSVPIKINKLPKGRPKESKVEDSEAAANAATRPGCVSSNFIIGRGRGCGFLMPAHGEKSNLVLRSSDVEENTPFHHEESNFIIGRGRSVSVSMTQVIDQPGNQIATPNNQTSKKCNSCFSNIGPGLKHLCTRKEMIKNVTSSLTPRAKEQVCSALLKDISNSDIEKDNAALTLATQGRPIKVSLEKEDKNVNKRLTFEDFNDLRMSKNLSTNQVKAISAKVRQTLGRDSVEPNVREYLHNQSKLLYYFEVCNMDLFERQEKKLVAIKRPAVIAEDIANLIDYVKQHRNIQDNDNILIKLGLDGGQEFLKATLNIVDVQKFNESQSGTSKDTGIKKLLILFISPQVSEIYENLRIIFQKLNLACLGIKVSMELKLANMIIGIQTHGAQHPCCYCETTSGVWEKAPERTLGNIRANFLSWKQNGSNYANAKKYKNCVHPPLLNGTDNTAVIDLRVNLNF